MSALWRFFYRSGSEWSQCAHWCSWVWPWNISGVDQQQNICTTANVGFVSFLGSAYLWHSAAHQLSNLFINFDLLFILSLICLMYFKIRFLLKKWWYNTLVLVLRQFLIVKISVKEMFIQLSKMTTTDTFPNYKANLEQNRIEILVSIPSSQTCEIN